MVVLLKWCVSLNVTGGNVLYCQKDDSLKLLVLHNSVQTDNHRHSKLWEFKSLIPIKVLESCRVPTYLHFPGLLICWVTHADSCMGLAPEYFLLIPLKLIILPTVSLFSWQPLLWSPLHLWLQHCPPWPLVQPPWLSPCPGMESGYARAERCRGFLSPQARTSCSDDTALICQTEISRFETLNPARQKMRKMLSQIVRKAFIRNQ